MKQQHIPTETNRHTRTTSRFFRTNGHVGCVLMLSVAVVLTGCSSTPERKLRKHYNEVHHAAYDSNDSSVITTVDETTTLDDYLRLALAQHPGLRATFDRWQAAIERLPQARALEDPTLSFEYFIEQRDSRYQASLTQRFPAFGKRTLREKRAAAEAEAAMHALETERHLLTERVIQAFQEYLYLAQATRVTKENLHLLEDLERVVATQYKTGTAPFSELITTQMERDRLANELESLHDQRTTRSSTLSALLNLPRHDILPWPKPFFSDPTPIDGHALNTLMITMNPELKSANARITAEEYREQLARKRFLPDFILGANWMMMGGMNDEHKSDVGLMAGMTLPIWRDNIRAEIREANALTRAAAGERENRVNTLRSDLSQALFTLRDAERRIELFSNALIPKANQALKVATQEFSSGKPVFMLVINAQRTLLEFKLMSERAKTDREIALAAISRLVGKDVGKR